MISAPNSAAIWRRSAVTLSGMTSATGSPCGAPIIASAMPVLPDVGSRMTESGPSTPRRSRSSTRYFAARSFTDPVGLSISSFAYRRTAGLGHIRGISTSGVWPMASRIDA